MVYVCNGIQKIEEAALASFYQKLDEPTKQRADACRNVSGRQQLLGARMLLLAGLKAELGWETLPPMGQGRQGKPFFPGAEQVFFNISHSHSCVAAAIHTQEVGVDVELIREAYEPQVADRVFTPKEMRMIRQPADFYLLWAQKESYIKAVGKGLGLPLRELEFSRIGGSFDSFGHRFMCGPFEEYALGVCWKGAEQQMPLRAVLPQQLG